MQLAFPCKLKSSLALEMDREIWVRAKSFLAQSFHLVPGQDSALLHPGVLLGT